MNFEEYTALLNRKVTSNDNMQSKRMNYDTYMANLAERKEKFNQFRINKYTAAQTEAIKKQAENKKAYNDLLNFDLGAGKKEINELESLLSKATGLKKDINTYSAQANKFLKRSKGLPTDGGFTEKKNTAEKELQEYMQYLSSIGYSSIDDLQNLINQKKKYLSDAESVQSTQAAISKYTKTQAEKADEIEALRVDMENNKKIYEEYSKGHILDWLTKGINSFMTGTNYKDISLSDEEAKFQYARNLYYSTKYGSEEEQKRLLQLFKSSGSTEYSEEIRELTDSLYGSSAVDEYLSENAKAGYYSISNSGMSTINALISPFLPEDNWWSNETNATKAIYEGYKKSAGDAAFALGDKDNIGGSLIQMGVEFVPDLMLMIMSKGSSASSSSTLKRIADAGTAMSSIGKTSGAVSKTSKGLQLALTQATKETAKNPLFWSSVARTYGIDYENALEGGADEATAYLYATMTSVLNALVEVGGGLETRLPKQLQNKSKTQILDFVMQAIEEGNEEVIQGLISELNELLYNTNKEFFSLENQDAIINPQRMATEWGMGTLGGAVLGGGTNLVNNVVTNKNAVNKYGKQIQKNTAMLNDYAEYARTASDSSINEIAQKVLSKESVSNYEAGVLGIYAQRQINYLINPSKSIEENSAAVKEILDGDYPESIKQLATAGHLSAFIEKAQTESSSYAYNKNNTLAESVNGEREYSIELDDGGKYVKINTDQKLFDGKSTREMQDIARKLIRDKFKGKVLAVGEDGKAYINKRSSDEYAYPANRRMETDVKESKMRAAPELENILSISQFIEHRDDDGRHPQATGGWDVYSTRFEVGGNMFSGEVQIMVTDRGYIFHDITKIKRLPVNGGQTETISVAASGSPLEGNNIPSNNSIPNSPNIVKENSPLSEVSAENAETDMAQSLINDALGIENLSEGQKTLRKIGKAFGVEIGFKNLDEWRTDENGKRYLFSPDGEYDPKTGKITLNTSKRVKHSPVAYILKHELTHSLEKNGVLYNDFADAVMESTAFKNYIKEKGFNTAAEYNADIVRQYTKKGVKNFDEGKADLEMVANFVGDMLFGGKTEITSTLIEGMEPKPKRSFIQWIKDALSYFKQKLTGQKVYVDEITQLEEKFLETVRSAQTKENTAQHDGEKSFSLYNHRGNLINVDWDTDNFSSLSQQLKNHLEEINEMQPVANVHFEPTTGKKLYQQVEEEYKKIGFKVDVQNFGTIILDEGVINLAISSYINTDAEAAALISIPKVLKRGKIISGHQNHKNRNYPTITFAAPVELNGKIGNVVVAVKVTGKTRYNAHRVLMPDGTEFVLDNEKNIELQSARVTNKNESQRSAKSSMSNNRVTQKPSIVNNNSMQETKKYSLPQTTDADSLLEQYESGEITREEYLERIKGERTLNPVEIGRMTKEDASTTPPMSRKQGENEGDSESKTYQSLQKSDIFDDEFKDEVKNDEFIKQYQSITNKETLAKAARELDEGGQSYVNQWNNIEPERASLMDITVGMILMYRYQRVGDTQSAIAAAQKVRKMGTASGRQVQIFSILGRFDPNTMLAYAQKELDDAFEALVDGKSQKWIDKYKERLKLTDEDIDYIRRKTLQAARLEEGTRAKAIVLGQIAARIQDKIPANIGDKIRTLQRISMLLNPKTNVRNITGNAGMVPIFIASDFFGSMIDKQMAKKTETRTTGNFTLKGSGTAFKKGLSESWDDFKRGIRTRMDDLNRFDVNKSGGKVFDDGHGGKLAKQLNALSKKLNEIDNFTSFCLEAGDRSFFEMWMNNSLNNQLQLNNVEIPTPEMLEIARQEALQRTWQDDNKFTRTVAHIKRSLNGVHIPGTNYGLGDFVLKFVKTPSNIAKAIVEFSPAGFAFSVPKLIKMKNSIETGRFTPQMQKEAVRSLSNAITGTLVYALVAVLASVGAIELSGAGDEDKDAANFEKYVAGIAPYSINFFGTNISYDWMQPFGSVLAVVADFMESRKENPYGNVIDDIFGALKIGGQAFTEQSFLSSLYELFSSDGIIEGLVSAGFSEPAAFVPQAFSQLASFTDNKRRVTYDPTSEFKTAWNRVIAKIPGLRQTLPEQVNVLGESVSNNQFLNPWEAFVAPGNSYSKSSGKVADGIYELYKATGNKSVMPKVAPNYISVKGNKITFTPDKKMEYQSFIGKISAEILDKMFRMSEYNSLSEEQKADAVKEVYNYATARAKCELEYDYDMLSAMEGTTQSGTPYLTKAKYNSLSEGARKQMVKEYFLTKAERLLKDDSENAAKYFIKRAKD